MLPSVSNILKCLYTSNKICCPFMNCPSRTNCAFMLLIALILSPDKAIERADAGLVSEDGETPLSCNFARVTPPALPLPPLIRSPGSSGDVVSQRKLPVPEL